MSGSQGHQAFLTTNEVTRRLGIGRATLQNMYNYIPYLYVSKTETRLFPAAYIDAYSAYLKRSNQKAVINTAANFWRTDEARRLYTEAVARLEAGLSRQTLTTGELAELLGIPITTILGWNQRGVLKALRQKSRPKLPKGGGRLILLFPSRNIKQAIQWKEPITRKAYVPPRLAPMFMSAIEVRNLGRKQHRDIASTAQMGQLKTPGGGYVVPTIYVEALLKNTAGPIDNRVVWTFNASRAAKAAIAAAKKEFVERLDERWDASPFKDLLVIEDIAWLLGVKRSVTKLWCNKGQLPYVEGPGRKLVNPKALQDNCKWILPIR